MNRGKFVVVDGLDGVGKGVFIQTFAEEARKEGKRVFDVAKFWKEHNFHPPIKEIIGKYDVILTAEPTFCGAGRYIREELVAKNSRDYSPQVVAETYAVDRRMLYEVLILPMLENGIDVYQSRSFATSIVYQKQSALDQNMSFSHVDILSIPGNAFCYNNPMNFLVIPTIINVEEVMKRLEHREKQDHCKFENLSFQLKAKQHYESNWFKEIFRAKGIPLVYMNAAVSLEFSKQQAREFYEKYLR